ncbi:hypothetical protein QTQ03_09520 [Micromonospora sp. WMMA1363]|uniref:hypothetical protein n=1 Tax=Micromonospora sp. WMMA1363 TaxID=3053985 RepID=UPI00259CD0F2|nr:hypothetical protein [Micromonospora sp. WMMA1363]MDM4719803.1 hypothetical protein [Micromonospora sp. WMMA1363]
MHALILSVADLLWFRAWYVLVVNADGNAVTFGPFASGAEATSLGARWQGTLLQGDPSKWGVVKVKGLGGTAGERSGGGFGFCSNEGVDTHPAYAHSMAGSSRGHCVVCGRHGACGRYTQAKAKATNLWTLGAGAGSPALTRKE